MPQWLAKTADLAKTTRNVIRSLGPCLISQSDSASEAYARHLARIAAVDAGKELLLQEIHTLTDVKRKLLEQFITADAEERVRIRSDLDEISASLRHLNVGAQSLKYLAASTNQPQPPSESSQEVSPHWIDKFGELARTRNEPWREDLLARMLATESGAPGTVSPRLLWLVGTLEQDAFDAFAILLDLSAKIARGLIIPDFGKFNDRPIPECSFGNDVVMGSLLYRLEEIGLFADPLTTSLNVHKGEQLVAQYGTKRILIECAGGDLKVGGAIPTQLGTSLATFYEPKVNLLGQEMFDSWVASLDTNNFAIKPLG